MTRNLIENGKLDRPAAAEGLQEFLEERNAPVDSSWNSGDVRAWTGAVAVGRRRGSICGSRRARQRDSAGARRGIVEIDRTSGFPCVAAGAALHEKIHLDCGGYRALRFEELRMTARVAAERVQASQQPFRLNPMTSRERRIVHLALQGNGRSANGKRRHRRKTASGDPSGGHQASTIIPAFQRKLRQICPTACPAL